MKKIKKNKVFQKKINKLRTQRNFSDKFFENHDKKETILQMNQNFIEEEKKEKAEKNSKNEGFHQFLTNYFDYDPKSGKFFSKKKFITERPISENPIDQYEKVALISPKILILGKTQKEISIVKYYEQNKCFPNSPNEFFRIMKSFFYLNIYKMILNSPNNLLNENFLLENDLELVMKFNLAAITSKFINLKTFYHECIDLVFFLFIFKEENETRYIMVYGLELSTLRKTPSLIIRAPNLIESKLIDAFFIVELQKTYANLLLLTSNTLVNFKLIILKSSSNNLILLQANEVYNINIPIIEKARLLSQKFLILNHKSLRRIYKFDIENKTFIKKDLQRFTVKLMETEERNRITVIYTESQKVLLLNENLEIIYHELFCKIEQWKIIQAKNKEFDMLVIRSGYNNTIKFLFYFRFNFVGNIWSLSYFQLKNINSQDFSFGEKINFHVYERNSTNIIKIDPYIFISDDFYGIQAKKNSVALYEFHETNIISERQNVCQIENPNENLFMYYKIENIPKYIFFLIFERNDLKIFILTEK